MDTAAIKKFAVWARNKLLSQMEQKAFELGITAKGIKEFANSGDQVKIHGQLVDKEKRDQLIQSVKTKGFHQVMEEMAYTWFNRFIALRFMEVNGYLPSGVRILSSKEAKSVEPDIFREITDVYKELNLNLDKVFELQDTGDSEKLFKYLIIAQCNALHQVLPFMFEPLDDYSELFFPDNLLVEDSIIRQMITTIDESQWKEVEIIGWLYQFYVAEKKDEIFASLTGRNKVSKEDIPAVTQLFTPKWIVQYMVDNSLGRLWQESHPESEVLSQLRYYLEPVEQVPEVQQKLDSLRDPNLMPEDITVMDPACGSGHILVYAFDVLAQIYAERGYLANEVPALILKHNLFGLEIDDRAAQLASFALMVQARRRDPHIFQKGILPNILAIQESAGISESFLYTRLDKESREIADDLIIAYKDAKNLGSILNPKIDNLDILTQKLTTLKEQNGGFTEYGKDSLLHLQTLIEQTKLLNKKYDVVVTNPPYMGSRNMNAGLTQYLRESFPTSRRDLFAVFMARMRDLTENYGYHVTVTMQSWMFLSSFEKFRLELLKNYSIVGLTHMANMVMGIAFGTVATILKKNVLGIKGTYQYVDLINLENNKPITFPIVNERYSFVAATDFDSIPGSPIAYWVSENTSNAFQNTLLYDLTVSPSQNVTGNNKKYLRFFWEIEKRSIGQGRKWIFYGKGGGYRKWYGNLIDVVNWSPQAREIYRTGHASQIIPEEYWYKPGITWGLVTSGPPSFRVLNEGSTYDKGGSSLFIRNPKLYRYVLGFLNSLVSQHLISVLNVTINFQVRDVRNLPLIVDSELERTNRLVRANITISKTDWDSLETSWDFKRHPLLVHQEGGLVETAFKRWEEFAKEQFLQLKANEEELNRIFIEIYGLGDELTPDVSDEDVTIRRAERERDLKSFISYAVGCMFGRYSLDEEGLIYAGGEFELNRYQSFKVAENGILPVLDAEYFEDDIVSRFVDFVGVIFGQESLEENLEYIADSVGRRKTDSAREGIRRYFLRDFYKDHVRIYKKRPIYWLFRSSSGVFNALVYLHRYDRDTVGRVRTDYLLALQDRLAAEESGLRRLLNTELSRQEETKTRRRLEEIDKQMKELQEYHGKIHNLANQRIHLDLDDGVAVNYKKLGEALARL